MNKYQRGKIYKIVSDLNDDVYIGSTTEPTLARRLAQHKGQHKAYLDGKRNYITSFKIIDTGSYSIILIEDYPCDNKDQLRARERHHIETTPNCVNKNLPSRTASDYYKERYDGHYKDYYKERYKTKKDYFKEHRQAYYKANQEALKKQQKRYRDSNKLRISIYKSSKYLLKKVRRTIEKGEELIQKYMDAQNLK